MTTTANPMGTKGGRATEEAYEARQARVRLIEKALADTLNHILRTVPLSDQARERIAEVGETP